MNEDSKNLQKAAVGIDVTIEHLADLKYAVIEHSIAVEKMIELQKDILVRSGRPLATIEAHLDKIDAECRRRVATRLKRDPRSDGEGELPPGVN